MKDGIVITANRSDEEPWRLERLVRTLKIVLEQGLTGTDINNLHDHKGLLTVIWEIPPTPKQRKCVVDAWATEEEENVQHCLASDTSDELDEYLFDESGDWEVALAKKYAPRKYRAGMWGEDHD